MDYLGSTKFEVFDHFDQYGNPVYKKISRINKYVKREKDKKRKEKRMKEKNG